MTIDVEIIKNLMNEEVRELLVDNLDGKENILSDYSNETIFSLLMNEAHAFIANHFPIEEWPKAMIKFHEIAQSHSDTYGCEEKDCESCEHNQDSFHIPSCSNCSFTKSN